MTFGSLVALALHAVRNPREAATTVLSIGVPTAAILPAFVLVIVSSVMLSALVDALSPAAPEGPATMSPLAVAALLCVLLGAFIVALHRAGRAMGGTGSLEETALLMVFLQFILLLAQAVEVLLWVMAPPLAGIFVLMAAIAAFWINVNFVDVLHGYGSLLKSFGLIIAVSLGLAIFIMLLITLSGANLQAVS